MTEAQPAPELLDSAECAALLRCTPEQIEELARAGEIPGLKFGRSRVFLRADLLIFLAEKARGEAADRRAKRAAIAVQPASLSLRKRGRTPPPLPPVPQTTRYSK